MRLGLSTELLLSSRTQKRCVKDQRVSGLTGNKSKTTQQNREREKIQKITETAGGCVRLYLQLCFELKANNGNTKMLMLTSIVFTI